VTVSPKGSIRTVISGWASRGTIGILINDDAIGVNRQKVQGPWWLA